MSDPVELSADLLNLDRITILDAWDLERALGFPITELQARMNDATTPRLGLVAAIVWVKLRKERPGLTLEEAASMLTLEELAKLSPGDSERDAPSPLAASGSESPASP